ncbi:dTMP kinase [Candidatus Woesearchaeota archaeon]|nr:dTMP kinase [Candidatus Woesearchaeota archaeon]
MGKKIFIVLDGMDGAGKSKMMQLLHNYLFSKDKSYRILTTREPTNGTYGVKIREMLVDDKDPKKNAKKILGLFLKDREEHVEKTIKPFLNSSSGKDINVVLCDRYYHSTMAFQSMQGINIEELVEVNGKFPKPDLTFIMDLEPEIALERMKNREKEKFEELNFMTDLRKKFLGLPKILNENIKIIDASKSIEIVFDQIKKEVDLL